MTAGDVTTRWGGEPPVVVDRCTFCHHSWHGLPCQTVIMARGYANQCTCPSANPQFRGVSR